MKLFAFNVFLLLTDVQSYKPPTVKLSSDVIKESSSVKISCETPADVSVNPCYFYTNREEKNVKVSSSCDLDLTGAEVLRWAAVKSPESLNIYCFYTIHERGISQPSSHSPPATVTVLDSLQKPIISANTDNDMISCEIPLSVRADFICSLYTEDDLLYQRVSQRSGEKSFCMFYVSPGELTRSVNSRQLSCVYSPKTKPEIRSPHSDTHTIRGLPQARLSASASVILETDTVQLSCENTEDLKMEMCYFYITGAESNLKLSSSCQLSLTGSHISIWSGGQSSSVRISCFYTVMKRQVSVPSPHSDPVTVTVQISTSTTTEQTTTTAMKTSSTVVPTSETTTYSKSYLQSSTNIPTSTAKKTTSLLIQKTSHLSTVISTLKTPESCRTGVSSVPVARTQGLPTLQYKDILWYVLVSIGLAVIFSILMGLFLCWFASKKRRKVNKTGSRKPDVPSQGTGMSCSEPAEAYSLITSVPASSQLISAGVLVNKQQERGNLEETENVYHLYCTIPENSFQKPVHSDADQAYSLVKMH